MWVRGNLLGRHSDTRELKTMTEPVSRVKGHGQAKFTVSWAAVIQIGHTLPQWRGKAQPCSRMAASVTAGLWRSTEREYAPIIGPLVGRCLPRYTRFGNDSHLGSRF